MPSKAKLKTFHIFPLRQLIKHLACNGGVCGHGHSHRRSQPLARPAMGVATGAGAELKLELPIHGGRRKKRGGR